MLIGIRKKIHYTLHTSLNYPNAHWTAINAPLTCSTHVETGDGARNINGNLGTAKRLLKNLVIYEV